MNNDNIECKKKTHHWERWWENEKTCPRISQPPLPIKEKSPKKIKLTSHALHKIVITDKSKLILWHHVYK